MAVIAMRLSARKKAQMAAQQNAKKMTELAEHAQAANKAKTAFLSHMSHEIQREEAKIPNVLADPVRLRDVLALDAGMNAHLSKPIVIDEVIKTILRHVHFDKE